MITRTFSFLPGIGEKLEKRLWRNNILSWVDFLAAGSVGFLSAERKYFYDGMLMKAQQNLDRGNFPFFAGGLKHGDHWRLFQLLRGKAVALDIETNGGTPDNGGCVTVVGLCDGFDYKALVKGRNLNKHTLEHELSRYSYIITFYGSVFDLPYLRDTYGLNLAMPHFDLCFSGRKAGLRGGLKRVEELLCIQRDESVRGLDGFAAVRLWQEAERGSSEALELLITYNRCDTVNLFDLAAIIYERLMARSGITEYLLRRENSSKPDKGCAYET